jgi:hypothetical protein
MSTPPNMPPGGGQPPYTAYDPKTQWRVYREQQKAAWRAQRDAMKAQRYAAKAGYYGGVYVPACALHRRPHHPHRRRHRRLSYRHRPHRRLRILELVRPLVAAAAHRRRPRPAWRVGSRRTRKVPVRRGGSFVGILILLAIIGLGAAGWDNWWGPFRANFGDQGDDFFNAFGRPERDFDQQVLNADHCRQWLH